MSTGRRQSRFQVISEGIPARTDPQPGGHVYSYDGQRFWRRTPGGKITLLPSWRTPQFGWRQEKEPARDLVAN